MKLTARVLDTHSASQYTDKARRVTLKVDEANCMNTRLTVRSEELREDEPLVLLVMQQEDADTLYRMVLARNFGDVEVDELAMELADQLRPDEPPFMATNVALAHRHPAFETGCFLCEEARRLGTADTQEFEREVVR